METLRRRVPERPLAEEVGAWDRAAHLLAPDAEGRGFTAIDMASSPMLPATRRAAAITSRPSA